MSRVSRGDNHRSEYTLGVDDQLISCVLGNFGRSMISPARVVPVVSAFFFAGKFEVLPARPLGNDIVNPLL